MRWLVVAVAAGGLLAGSAVAQDKSQTKEILPRAVIEQGLKQAKCDLDYDEATKSLDEAGDVQDLGGGMKLLSLPCWRAAYNFGSIIFAFDPKAPEKAKLQRFNSWDTNKKKLEPSFSVSGHEYDAESKTVASFHKFRGVGDCGSIGQWKWTGKEFRLAAYWAKNECDGEPFDDEDKNKWKIYPPRKKR